MIADYMVYCFCKQIYVSDRLLMFTFINTRHKLGIQERSMAYPKPLAEKSILKMYREAGINDDMKAYYHDVFSACANLYGAIDLRNIWDILKELEKNDASLPRTRRKDFLAVSSIARREELDYYVYEIDELYSEEQRNEMDRFIVSKQLVRPGYNKLFWFYELMDNSNDKPIFLPEDLLYYVDPPMTIAEAKLLLFISNLKSVADECIPKYGKAVPNENKGKTLREFKFFNADERFDLEYYKKKPGILKSVIENVGDSEAEKIVKQFKFRENIGNLDFGMIIQTVLDELDEVGVRISEKELRILIDIVNEYHNTSHLWCLSGWAPSDLAKAYGGVPGAVSFGPGIQKAFSEGTMDKDELVRLIKEMGLDVIE